MRSKLYLLLTVLSVIAICSAATDQASKKSDATAAVKKPAVAEDTADAYDEDDVQHDNADDEIDDSHSPKSSYAHNRFVSYNSPEDNYRTRSRWPAAPAAPPAHSAAALPFSIGELADDDDWSSAGYGSAFPTSFPPNSYKMHGMSNNGPSCNSLIDQQYPIFSDTCGAVPQARYSLPNALGHREKWQVAQLLNILMSSSNEPTCTRSLRLLLCPILFPSCSSRQQAPPVLPCQSFCRAVKSRCAIPMLESLPCEVLPYSSDLCPTNQGYGSFAPPRAFPNNMQSPPMVAGHPSARQYPTLQSLLSSPALQAALSAQSFQSSLNPQTLQAALSAQAFQPPLPAQTFHVPSLFAAQPAVPAAPVTTTTPPPPPPPPPQPTAATPAINTYSAAQFPTESISTMLSDFGSRTYGNEYRQGSRYAPYMRSSNDVRPSADLRAPTEARQQANSRPRIVAYPPPTARQSTARPPTASSMVKA